MRDQQAGQGWVRTQCPLPLRYQGKAKTEAERSEVRVRRSRTAHDVLKSSMHSDKPDKKPLHNRGALR